jgi:transmembrane sensor
MQRELIDKYFRNECSDDERQQVLEYFRNNPEEWNRYMNEDDWDQYIVNEELPQELSEDLFDRVSRQTFRKSRRRMMFRLAAAAVIVSLLGVSLWGYLTVRESRIQRGIASAGTQEQMTEKRNDTDKSLRVQLADGSFVVLGPHSYIRYYEPFVSDRNRGVHLWGKALFNVEKDQSRAFIVYSDMLATTVLGTSFTVDAFPENNVIRVQLHKGKVQVTAADTLTKQWNGKEILRPGDELIYDKATMIASIKRNAPAEQMVRVAPAGGADYNVRRPDSYTFDISPLSEVFDQLSSYYQIEIYYYPSEMNNKYFSGRMRKTDKLETILNDIAILNQLTIEKDHNRYIIREKK